MTELDQLITEAAAIVQQQEQAGEQASPAPAAALAPSVPSSAPAAGATYVPVYGDTTAGIAAQFGCTVGELLAWNSLTNPDAVMVGYPLIVGQGA